MTPKHLELVQKALESYPHIYNKEVREDTWRWLMKQTNEKLIKIINNPHETART